MPNIFMAFLDVFVKSKPCLYLADGEPWISICLNTLFVQLSYRYKTSHMFEVSEKTAAI